MISQSASKKTHRSRTNIPHRSAPPNTRVSTELYQVEKRLRFAHSLGRSRVGVAWGCSGAATSTLISPPVAVCG